MNRHRALAMASSRVFLFFSSLLALLISSIAAEEADSKEAVVTLDSSNFLATVSMYNFIVVKFSPRCGRRKKLDLEVQKCGHCKKQDLEYEKAASILSSNGPPVILAKVDANEEANKGLASEYDVRGFPTIKILRNGGKSIQEYKGPCEADGIVTYLKKQSGPASVEIKSADDATTIVGEKKIVVVGVFDKFSGEEYEMFLALAQKLRSDYEFGHTLDAKHLPRGDSSVTGPVVRLFKPFDECSVDFKEFNAEALEKFIEESSSPVVTEFNNDPDNHPFVIKFFNGPNDKVMLFLNFNSDVADAFKLKYSEVAEKYKGEGISFLVGDLKASQGPLQYFGLKDDQVPPILKVLKEDQVPLIIMQADDGQKFMTQHLEPDHISCRVKEYMEMKKLNVAVRDIESESNLKPLEGIPMKKKGAKKSFFTELIGALAFWRKEDGSGESDKQEEDEEEMPESEARTDQHINNLDPQTSTLTAPV